MYYFFFSIYDIFLYESRPKLRYIMYIFSNIYIISRLEIKNDTKNRGGACNRLTVVIHIL